MVHSQRSVCGAILAVVIGGALVLGVMNWSMGLFQHKQQDVSVPSVPISVRLYLSYAPWLNRVAELTCSVTVIFQASNLSVEITLPEGIALVSGDLSWSGSLPEKGKTDLKALIKAVKVGNWTIEAKAGYPIGGGWYSNIARIYLSVSENSAYIILDPFSETVGRNATRTTRSG